MNNSIKIALASFSLLWSACSQDLVAEGARQSDGGGEAGAGSESDTGNPPPPDAGTPVDPNEQIPPRDGEGCHAIYAQDLLPTFELSIHPVVWEALEDEWNNGQANEDAEGVNPKPYHPLEAFRYGDIVIEDAEIRLRGNPSNWDPLPEDKMQFQIGFHRNDPENGHFLGIKRLAFDAHTYNRHLLRDRLSLAFMRDVGIPAPCANNARLVINGEYYGIFTNLEKMDEVYVERAFADPTGDLWKRQNWKLKTNKDSSNDTRVKALRDAQSLEETEAYLDLEQALRVYAAEAIIPNSDGPWAGGMNFYLYDNPLVGKFWLLPTDLDQTFERFVEPPDGDYPVNPDPVVWEKPTTHGRTWYDYALEDPVWFGLYIDLIDELLHEGYAPYEMHARIDEWTAQIQDAVLEDVNKPYDNDKYLEEVDDLHAYIDGRYAFVGEWLECWQDGGVADGEGYCVP